MSDESSDDESMECAKCAETMRDFERIEQIVEEMQKDFDNLDENYDQLKALYDKVCTEKEKLEEELERFACAGGPAAAVRPNGNKRGREDGKEEDRQKQTKNNITRKKANDTATVSPAAANGSSGDGAADTKASPKTVNIDDACIELSRVIFEIHNAATAKYAAIVTQRTMHAVSNAAAYSLNGRTAVFMKIGSVVLKKIRSLASQNMGHKSASAITEYARQSILSDVKKTSSSKASAARATPIKVTSTATRETAATAVTAESIEQYRFRNLEYENKQRTQPLSTHELERVRRFFTSLHAEWWSKEESTKDLTLMWLITFLIELRKKSRDIVEPGSNDVARGKFASLDPLRTKPSLGEHISSCICQVVMIDFLEQLKTLVSIYGDSDTIRKVRCSVYLGASVSFIVGLSRALGDERLYVHVVRHILRVWLRMKRSPAPLAHVTATLELLYVVARDVWDDSLERSGSRQGLAASTTGTGSVARDDGNAEVGDAAGPVFALVHAHLVANNANKPLRKAINVRAVEVITSLLDALEKNIREMSFPTCDSTDDCTDDNFNTIHKRNALRVIEIERLGELLDLCCAMVGWKEMRSLNVFDRLVPVVCASKSVDALRSVFMPLFDVVTDEAQVKDTKNPEKFRQVMDVVRRLMNGCSEDDKPSVAFRHELMRKFPFSRDIYISGIGSIYIDI